MKTAIVFLAALASLCSTAATASLTLVPQSLDFGGVSIGTGGPTLVVNVTNAGTAPVLATVTSTNDQFGQRNDCASIAAGAKCTIRVRFAPFRPLGPLNSRTPLSGEIVVTSNAPGSPHAIAVSGVNEQSLVSHYYVSILRRPPDAGGLAYWESEAKRISDLGAHVNEAWFAMAGAFFASPEYAAFNRGNTDYVRDLYVTFLSRMPDAGGLAYWTGQMSSGLPREVALVSFMFSPEFILQTSLTFGAPAARPEIDTVLDFYRGLLARLPDSAGFEFWLQRFRAAQCQGATAVYEQVESISSAFANSAEQAARARGNAQFVGDLYNAFLRRGGDLEGVRFWIGQLDTGAKSREQLRREFIASAEFSARVSAMIAQGCR